MIILCAVNPISAANPANHMARSYLHILRETVDCSRAKFEYDPAIQLHRLPSFGADRIASTRATATINYDLSQTPNLLLLQCPHTITIKFTLQA